MSDQLTKKCPFCGEEIRAEAIKCRYCRELLDTEQPTVPPPTPLQNVPSREHDKDDSPVERPPRKPNIPPEKMLIRQHPPRKKSKSKSAAEIGDLAGIIVVVILLFVISKFTIWKGNNNNVDPHLKAVEERMESGQAEADYRKSIVPEDRSKQVLDQMASETVNQAIQQQFLNTNQFFGPVKMTYH